MAKKSASSVGKTVTKEAAKRRSRRQLRGTVVSDKMTKTIVVKVDRKVKHPLFKKYVNQSRRFKAHDEKNDAKVGDLVSVVESRPLSKEKRWVLTSVLRRAGQESIQKS